MSWAYPNGSWRTCKIEESFNDVIRDALCVSLTGAASTDLELFTAVILSRGSGKELTVRPFALLRVTYLGGFEMTSRLAPS